MNFMDENRQTRPFRDSLISFINLLCYYHMQDRVHGLSDKWIRNRPSHTAHSFAGKFGFPLPLIQEDQVALDWLK